MRPVAGRSQAGESLIEMVVAIAIMGIALVGLLPAVANSLTSADRVKKHATVEQVLSTAVQKMNSSSYSATCDYSAILNSISAAPNPTIVASNVNHWSGNSFIPGCPAAGLDAVFKSLRIRLTVATPDGRSTAWVEVVKRP